MSEDQSQQESKPKRSLLLVVFAVLNIMAITAGVTFAYLGSFPEKKVVKEDVLMQEWQEVNKNSDDKRHLYTLVPFNANLNEMPRRFVRLSMQLEMLDETGFEEISDLGAEARDEILKIINEKTVAEIRSVQGKLVLKDEIMTAMNKVLQVGIVKNAYFTDFAIQ